MSLIFEIYWNPERMMTEVFKIGKGDRKGLKENGKDADSGIPQIQFRHSKLPRKMQ